MNIEQVVAAVEKATGRKPQQNGNGFKACCPAHDDNKESLSVNEGDGGRVLLHCFAGCDYEAIVTAFRPHLGPECGEHSSEVSEVEATYDYTDEEGKLLFQKVRFRPKRFVQQRIHTDGLVVQAITAGWYQEDGGRYRPIPGATNQKSAPGNGAVWFDKSPRVLYRLPEVHRAIKSADRIYVVEGEKDADRLASCGLCATTNSGGASEKWHDEYTSSLTGGNVVIIPDNDDPGKKHVVKVATALKGVAVSVRVLNLPGLSVKGTDVSDWLDAGNTVEQLESLASEAPEWLPANVHILDASPEVIARPLDLVAGHGYSAAWVFIGDAAKSTKALVIVRDDGVMYSDADLPASLRLDKLGVMVQLDEPLPPGLGWSGAGVKKYVSGTRPDPRSIFQCCCKYFNAYIDFDRSFASQEVMCELLACYTVATYFLPAMNVVGYLWSNGDKGAGKTKLLKAVSTLAYLGQLILNGSSFASLRDLAHYGATLCAFRSNRPPIPG